MVKLNERKIHVGSSSRNSGRGTGELALIQRVSRRRVEQLWQAYRRTGTLPTLKKPGGPRRVATSLREAIIVMKAYDDVKANASSLEHTLKQSCGLNLPHNRLRIILKETGRALDQPAKQARRKWVRYEREHSMSLWHTDWKQLDSGEWLIVYEDDASRLITGYCVFQDATAENTIRVLE
jgi:putative transposase